MILKRFYDDKLAQASYLVGCAATGEALVVDASRDLEPIIQTARKEGLRITHVTETHIHADYVSGARELAERTGAQLFLSGEGGEDWQYGFADASRAVLLRDGDSFLVGNVRVEAMHTPGHTPEHLSFVITDTAGADQPMGVFTGDFIFVGDVGRPDLLETAAKHEGTMEAGARVLHGSLERFKNALPDYVQLWPGHGAGSACGKSLGAVPQTTLGYERLFNWGLAEQTEEEFVAAVLDGQPDPPMYFAEMKRINRDGPPVRGGFPEPERLALEQLEALLDTGAVIVDTRAARRFEAAHVPGSLSIPFTRSFPTWAGSVLPFDRDLYLIVDDTKGARVHEAVRDLAMIGLDRVVGWFGAEVVREWRERNGAGESITGISPDRVEELMTRGEIEVVDVRNASEWEAGHVPGSLNVPLGRLPESLERIPRDIPLVVHCETGSRSGVAISVLRAHGFSDVHHLTGDFSKWSAAGRPVERGPAGRPA